MYECKFTFQSSMFTVFSEDGIGAFCNGFWIDQSFNFTKLSDGVYWIPPSVILFVKKRTPR